MGERCNAQRAHRSCDDDLQSDQTRFFPATLGIKIIVTAQPVPAAETGDVDLQNLTGDGTAPPATWRSTFSTMGRAWTMTRSPAPPTQLAQAIHEALAVQDAEQDIDAL